MFSPEDKRELLGIARGAIASTIEGKPFRFHAPLPENLLQHQGAFVTIRVDRQLRGCIGYIESLRPLAEVVAEVATKAAFEDPRFPPLTAHEFEQAALEISVLSPLHAVQSIEEVVVGVHGLVIELGGRRGLLLPQVALEYGWDRESFLDAVARKAGLHHSAWQDPETRLYAFSAEVFEEDEVMYRNEGDVS
jgi:AmmeMemoRadiSam system protein A